MKQKKIIAMLLIAVMLFSIMPVSAFATETSGTSGDVAWNYDTATKTLTISGNGSMGIDNSWKPVYTSEIQKVIIGSGVTNISNSAFSGCTALTSIEIANTVTSIDGNAFNSCSKLEHITIPDSVTNIGAYAFANCIVLKTLDYLGTVSPTGYDSDLNDPFLNTNVNIIVPDTYTGTSFCGKSVTKKSDVPEEPDNLSPVYVGGVQLLLGTNYINDSNSVKVSNGDDYNVRVTGNDTDGYVLNLNGLCVTGKADSTLNSAIYAQTQADMNIIVEQNSTVTGADITSRGPTAGIYAIGKIKITGSDKLTAIGGSCSDRDGISSGILCKELVVDNATVAAQGGECTSTSGTPISAGLGGSGDMSVTITGNNADVKAIGNKYGAILYNGNLTVENGTFEAESKSDTALHVGGNAILNGGEIIAKTVAGQKTINRNYTTTVTGKTIRYTFKDNTSTTVWDSNTVPKHDYIKMTVDNPDPLIYTLWLYTQGGSVDHTGVTKVIDRDQYKMNYIQYQGAELPPSTAMSRDGHRFWCWSTSDSELYPTGNLSATETGDRIIYAWWKQLHNINMQSSNNGTVSGMVKAAEDNEIFDYAVGAAENDTVTLTIKPDTGYTLAAISVKDANQNEVSLAGEGNTRTFEMPASDVTINATYEPIKVTFHANGGTGTMDMGTVTGANYTLPACDFAAPETTVPGGMNFAGWAYSADGDVISEKNITVNGNVDLYAIWQYTPVHNQTIEKNGAFDKAYTFDIDLGTLIPPDAKIKDGVNISASGGVVANTVPTYTIGSSSASLKIVTCITDKPASSSITMKIDTENYDLFVFTINISLNGYTIAYDLDGGSVATGNPAVYSSETATFTLTNPTKEGHIFKGWSGSDLSGEENKTVTIVQGSSGNRTYTAHWIEKEAQTVTVSADTVTVTYGDTVIPPKVTAVGTVSYSSSDESIVSVNASTGEITIHKAGTVTVTATAAETEQYAAGTASYTLVINKAEPTVTVDYTAITASGKTLADANLQVKSSSVDGSVAWEQGSDAAAEANKAYTWIFTPADTVNYTSVTGTITVYVPKTPSSSSGSGGGFSGSYNYPVTSADVDGADVTFSDNHATAGETVTITVTPDAGKKVDEVIVTDAKGNVIPVTKVGDNQYSFTMPVGRVNVSVSTETADYILRIVMQINNKNILVNNTTIVNDVAPVIIGDRTLVPVRIVTELLGGSAHWDSDTRTVTLKIDGKVLTLVIDEEIPGYGTGAVIINSRTYVPIRYVAEMLGANVEWIAATQQIVIEK